MKKILLCVLLLCCLSGQTQGFKVRHYLPGVKNHLSKAIFETTPGNYISGGLIQDSVNGVYTNRLCLMGLDAQGQTQWVKKYGNQKFVYLNNPFISSSFYKQGNFVYYAGAALDSNNVYLGLFIKFNLNGDTLWQKRFYDANDYVYPQMLSPSTDNGFLITGMLEDPVNVGRRILLIKTDANGTELWRKDIGKTAPNVNDGKAIVQDSASKKIVIIGYQYLPGNSLFDNVVILDSLGNQPQRYSYLNPLGGALYDLIQTRDKKLVAVGFRYVPQSSGGSVKSFIVKFDIDTPASPIWTINFDKTAAYNGFTCLTETQNGDLLVAGTLDTLVLQNQNANLLTRITKIDKNGVVLWKHYYNYKTNAPTSDNGQTIKSLNLTSDGGYVGAIECQNFPSPNPFFFVKWDSLGCDSSLAYCQMVAAGIGKNYAGATEISIYPNPNQGIFYLSLPASGAAEALLLTASDLSGREVKRLSLEPGKEKLPIDLSELSKGVYLVRVIKEGKNVYTGKVMMRE